MSIYRAQEEVDFGSFEEIEDRDTRRPPSNVPYVVDNLWEWARPDRPEAYPDRRKSKFASPKPDQALRSADLLEDCLASSDVSKENLRADGLPEECLEQVFRVEFVGDPVIAQLPGVDDAKNHPDCKRLPTDSGHEHLEKDTSSKTLRKVLFDKLGGKYGWSSKAMNEKHPAAQLFQPCLTAAEVERLFDTVDALQPHKDEIRREITYWNDVELIEPGELADEEEGEILFEFRDFSEEVGYRPRPVGTEN